MESTNDQSPDGTPHTEERHCFCGVISSESLQIVFICQVVCYIYKL